MKTSLKVVCLAILAINFGSCDKSEDEETVASNTSYTITVGAYTLDSTASYVYTGNDLVFDSQEECQTWSRTAGSDAHSTNSHLHYNAAANVSFDNSSTTFSWTEYGPELDQQTIESTCALGNNGANKTVNNTSYYQDKPNLYLKITSVVEN